MMSEMEKAGRAAVWEEQLLGAAREAMGYAHAPYSGFRVGAAVLCRDGSIVTGCNVENASYGLSMCAERVAIFRAIAEGKRGFLMLAVVADAAEPVWPCGACRQVMAEFFPGEALVCLGNTQGKKELVQMSELLPRPFGASSFMQGEVST